MSNGRVVSVPNDDAAGTAEARIVAGDVLRAFTPLPPLSSARAKAGGGGGRLTVLCCDEMDAERARGGCCGLCWRGGVDQAVVAVVAVDAAPSMECASDDDDDDVPSSTTVTNSKARAPSSSLAVDASCGLSRVVLITAADAARVDSEAPPQLEAVMVLPPQLSVPSRSAPALPPPEWTASTGGVANAGVLAAATRTAEATPAVPGGGGAAADARGTAHTGAQAVAVETPSTG